jgi:aquaporin Z
MARGAEDERAATVRLLGSDEVSPFSDTKLEWRRVLAELWGAFLLVCASAGGVLAHDLFPDKVTPEMAVAAPGLATTAIIYMLGDVSGAHLNPAVTLAFALRRNFPWARVPGYLAAQFAGGVAAALFMRLLFGPADNLGSNVPALGVSHPMGVLIEAVLTAGLMTTILGSAAGARNVGPNAALAVGGYTLVAKFWAWPLTGASMNPARTFGPDLVRGVFDHTWIYFAGPVIGAAAAVGIEWLLKGPPTESGDRAAQGEGKAGERADQGETERRQAK